MVKDVKTGEIFRADHLVEAVLEARLKGDKEARGVKEEEVKEDEADKKKKKKKVKSVAIKLEDSVVAEYESLLAQVSTYLEINQQELTSQIDNYTGPELGEIMKKYQIVNPETGNELTDPVEFNLMFESNIGPTGQIKG